MQEEDAAGVIDGREEGVGKLSTYTSIEKDISPRTCIKYILYPFCCKITKLCACADNVQWKISLTCLLCTHSK